MSSEQMPTKAQAKVLHYLKWAEIEAGSCPAFGIGVQQLPAIRCGPAIGESGRADASETMATSTAASPPQAATPSPRTKPSTGRCAMPDPLTTIYPRRKPPNERNLMPEPKTLVERLREHAKHNYTEPLTGEAHCQAPAADLRKAADLLEKLPTTADGVPVAVGDQVWHASNLRRPYPVECVDGEWEIYVNMDGHRNKWYGVQVWQCYSAESAARAAAEGKQDA